MTDTPTTYRIRAHGHLDDHWADWLGGVALTRNQDGTTTLTVPVADQAQLHGVLAGLRDIGATISELSTQDAPAPATGSLTRPLRTDRLTLRSATAADAEPTWRYRKLPSVNQWLTGSPTELDAYREQFSAADRLAVTVIVTLGHGENAPIIGDFMLRREDAWAQRDVADQARNAHAELGWVLDPAHTRHGYATEAVQELVRHCFQDLGLRRVTAHCFLANDASLRLMERIGMRRELHARQDALHRSGRWLDTLGYALLADDWSTQRSEIRTDRG